MSREWVTTIAKYFDDLLSGDLDIRDFCNGYESWWNFRRPASEDIYPAESDSLERVFDVVVVFCDDPTELKQIPMYKSEEDVRSAVHAAMDVLQGANTT